MPVVGAGAELADRGRKNPTSGTLVSLKTDQLDDLDRSLVHALQVNGRAPFGLIAAALGVSDHTIARRYRRLRSQGVLRVVGLPDSARLGRTDWFIRQRAVRDAAQPDEPVGAAQSHAVGQADDTQHAPAAQPPVTPRDGVVGYPERGGNQAERRPAVDLQGVHQAAVKVIELVGFQRIKRI